MTIPMRLLVTMNVALLAAVGALVFMLTAPSAGAEGETAAAATARASQGVPACYNRKTGALRVLISGKCSRAERRITLGQPGPTGPAGPAGPTGPAGPAASSCPSGNYRTIWAPLYQAYWQWQEGTLIRGGYEYYRSWASPSSPSRVSGTVVCAYN